MSAEDSNWSVATACDITLGDFIRNTGGCINIDTTNIHGSLEYLDPKSPGGELVFMASKINSLNSDLDFEIASIPNQPPISVGLTEWNRRIGGVTVKVGLWADYGVEDGTCTLLTSQEEIDAITLHELSHAVDGARIIAELKPLSEHDIFTRAKLIIINRLANIATGSMVLLKLIEQTPINVGLATIPAIFAANKIISKFEAIAAAKSTKYVLAHRQEFKDFSEQRARSVEGAAVNLPSVINVTYGSQ